MKHWIEAARVRTLPLSVSGIIVGSFYAMSQGMFNWNIVAFALLTTLGLQILSNFANDYGDGVKGTDNKDRVGPKRAIQSGLITPQAMKKAMILTSGITLIFAVLLIYFAFKESYLWYSLFFLVLGVFAIASAIRYTVALEHMVIVVLAMYLFLCFLD
jgi:1,4-dihydroxy-2-naphthoate octaprenyltransferase